VTVPAVVVGGGPAGAVAAATLAGAGMDVVVLAGTQARPLLGECLPAAAKPVLQQLGLWQAFQGAGHAPSPGIMSSWGQPGLGGRVAITDPYGPGWRLDRSRFDTMLLDLAMNAGAEVRRGVDVVGVTPHRGGVELRCRSAGGDHLLTPGFVVDASGRARRIAHALGGEVVHGDRLVGFATVIASESTDGRARVEAFPQGWWYSTAIDPSRHVVICFTDADLPAARLVRNPEGLAEMLATTSHLSDLAPAAGASSGVRAVAAGTSWLFKTSGPRWVAVGDAALAIDPLSGHGLLAAMVGAGRAAGAVGRRDLTYDRWITGRRVRHRAHQSAVYRLERRWPDGPFWIRRQRGSVSM
jgi:flavin-dependent dehydrogenase